AYDRDKKKGKAEDKLISTSNKVASDKVGINEQGMEIAHLYIYPNPASDRLNVEFTMLNAGKVDIRLLDITGREIAMILDEERATGKNNVAFNLGNIDKGIYFIKITAGGYNITRKVVKN
nr:T9SS type A sorting domain-containing protein [Bacteroidales bacterium]